MPLVRQLLITLRTLMEDEPPSPKPRRRRPNNNGRGNRNRQTTALVLTFRDLFRSSGLDMILDEIENNANNRSNRKYSHNTSRMSNRTSSFAEAILRSASQPANTSDSRLILREQNAPTMTPKIVLQDEATPLLPTESPSVVCTDIVPSPLPVYSGGLFGGLALVRHKRKPENLTVPLNPDDENKTVETLKKVLKWSPRKQNATTFAVSLPVEEKHAALAVVENAVNRVKEEQLIRKKKKKFLWLKFC